MTYKEFLRETVKEDSAKNSFELDFAVDALEDTTFPNVYVWEDLETYLFKNNACDEAIEGGESLFRRWKEKRCV